MDSPFPLILNGAKPGRKDAGQFVHALADPEILESSGGYLFKTCLWEGKLHISIVPAISEGERLHHYDINVPDPEHIIGSVSATGEFTLLFRAEKIGMDNEARKRWKSRFSAFAVVLIALGYRGKGQLDWITRQIIEESGIFDPIPDTLAEISARA